MSDKLTIHPLQRQRGRNVPAFVSFIRGIPSAGLLEQVAMKKERQLEIELKKDEEIGDKKRINTLFFQCNELWQEMHARARNGLRPI